MHHIGARTELVSRIVDGVGGLWKENFIEKLQDVAGRADTTMHTAMGTVRHGPTAFSHDKPHVENVEEVPERAEPVDGVVKASGVPASVDLPRTVTVRLNQLHHCQLTAFLQVAARFTNDPSLGLSREAKQGALMQLELLHRDLYLAHVTRRVSGLASPPASVLRYFWFALAAFGPSRLRTWNLLPSSVGSFKGGVEWLCKVSQSDVCVVAHGQDVCYGWGGGDTMFLGDADVCKSSYFITVDRASRSIVVAIRGSAQVTDAFTDACCGAQTLPLSLGVAQVHGGFLFAADVLSGAILAHVKAALDDHPRFDVVLTGHSSGGALAAVLCEVWSHERRFGSRTQLRCYSFGSPPIFDVQSSEGARSRIVSVVLGADVVPRLSLRSMDQFAQVLGVLRREPSADLDTVRMRSLESRSSGWRATVPPTLVVPGNIICLHEAGCVTTLATRATDLEEVLVLVPEMFDLHSPLSYLKALYPDHCAEGIRGASFPL